MAFPIVEFVGTVLGGVIAGLVGFSIARYNHNLALEDANRAAEKAKKDALRICLVDVRYSQSQVKMLLEREKLPTFGMHFPRTIYSALADRLGELPCRESIVLYYTSLETLENDMNKWREDVSAGVMDAHSINGASENICEYLEGVNVVCEQLLKCLEREIIAEG